MQRKLSNKKTAAQTNNQAIATPAKGVLFRHRRATKSVAALRLNGKAMVAPQQGGCIALFYLLIKTITFLFLF
jgi:hypothetical protein